jgi:hypothetical protein
LGYQRTHLQKSLVIIVAILVGAAAYYFLEPIVLSYLNTNQLNDVSNTSRDPSVKYENVTVQSDDDSFKMNFEFGPKDPTFEAEEKREFGEWYSFVISFDKKLANPVIFDVIIEVDGKEIDRLSNSSKSYGNKPFITNSGTAAFDYNFGLNPGTYDLSLSTIFYEMVDNKTLVQKPAMATINNLNLIVK